MSIPGGSNGCFLSPGALAVAELPGHLKKLGRDLSAGRVTAPLAAPAVVALASELIKRAVDLPPWSTGPHTRFVVLVDVPEAVLLRLASVLDLRRPEQRLHAATDAGVVRRLLIAWLRDEPLLSVVDAFIWDGCLNVVAGDLSFRAFPLDRVPLVSQLPTDAQSRFEIDEDGSYLHWPVQDLHLGVSQLLQQADPMYLTDMAVLRNREDHAGAAVRSLRKEKGLRQSDVPGLSERQVRRIEEGISRMRFTTAEKFASALQIDVISFLDEVARRAGAIRQASSARPRPRARKQITAPT